MNMISPKMLVGTEDWMRQNSHKIQSLAGTELINVKEEELCKASFLQHPQQVIGVFPIPSAEQVPPPQVLSAQLSLALDGVQDPGNLGTIIRIADWFGIEHIFCSEDTADVYNPKVVQATMGSMMRVKVHYVDLKSMLRSMPDTYPIYGTLLDGDDIYTQSLSGEGMIIMGNEGNGISPDIRQIVNRKLLIPNYPKGRNTAESLNVAIATAITCAEFRRR